ncbi:glycoside hydrolase family 16 protein [Cucurbitaria berberidis CBS 394.84]|uniref:Glycoside hydrolase family 16 protein n=1 Tax=Cucurbitaria berberidis CBS 394.84 TaxID=1168544 RepID=A0A9P4GUZ9_9PLEO|nr:glycoside hydrolase family 16 protein [Cucurbitaria berberidis CBS 394.84]KAF1851860.1 glycoside hydrolase family 16 protein [Cucurbitaria berberidis CBS 394.84]
MSPPQSPRGDGPPHIRLNSGTQEARTDDNAPPAVRPSTARNNSARSLTQPIRPGTASSAALRSATGSSLYKHEGIAESAEMLLPPRKLKGGAGGHYRDESPMSSRRTSWSSDATRDSGGPFASPFDDSRAPSRAGSEEDLNTQTVSEKFNILPSAGLLLFPEDVEKDDYLHNPDPNDKDKLECDVWNRRGLVNLGGLALLTIGLLFLFIGYPVMTFVDKMTKPVRGPCTNNPLCIKGKENEPLFKNLRTGLIDPDTPASAMTRTSADGSKQVLVFSDEFKKDGRTFYDGDDPYFQAVDIWYGATQDLEWYDPDAAYTENGTLNLKFDLFKNHGLNYRSGMVQSWNKLCYKGGHLEASISLPGRGDVSGFWPGFWTMGNLARPGYLGSTEGLWPYSYHDECDIGITPNQSSYDGLSYLPGMRLPACTCKGEDHPNPGRSRSAPEIDALEGSVHFLGPGETNAVGVVSQSFQAAPFDIWYMPDYNYFEVYNTQITMINAYKGGPYQQANSGLTNLNTDWYNGKQYQTYSFEYKTGKNGFITWYVGEDKTWTMKAAATRPNGNIGTRVIPEEPMAIIANFGMSNSFAAINLDEIQKDLPAVMRVDYIRIYQPENNQIVTCDPDDYPTTEYIEKHPAPYANPNLTNWAGTGFDWPKNSFMHDCKS